MAERRGPVWTEVTTIGDLLVRAATLHPHRDGVIFPDGRMTYQQILGNALEIARGLWSLGLRLGDHVGVLMGNGPDYIGSFFGASLMGCVVVPLNVRHRTAELGYIIANADLQVILTSGRDADYVDLPALLAQSLGPLGTTSDRTVSVAAAPKLRHIVNLSGHAPAPFIDPDSFRQLSAATAPEVIDQSRRGVLVRGPALILYTSGTTAHPKGCLLSHEAVTRGPVERARHRLKAPDKDVTWAAGPLYHIGSLAPFIGSVGVAGSFLCDRFFEPGRAITLMRTEGVTLAWPWFPAIVHGILDHPDFQGDTFDKLRHLFLIAPETLVRKVQSLLPHAEIIQACGMTETGGVFALSDPDEDATSRALTQGKACPGVEIRIVDCESEQDCPAGRMGEIWVRGACVMEGYYQSIEQTRAAMTTDGWLKTGDLYLRDQSGSLLFQGRVKDMLKVGGENVGTMELEAFLCSCPGVKLAEVVGRPDARLDEVPVAFIERAEHSTVSEAELIAYCKGRIASYKIPRAVYFVAPGEWPMSATKVDKRALRDRLKVM